MALWFRFPLDHGVGEVEMLAVEVQQLVVVVDVVDFVVDVVVVDVVVGQQDEKIVKYVEDLLPLPHLVDDGAGDDEGDSCDPREEVA